MLMSAEALDATDQVLENFYGSSLIPVFPIDGIEEQTVLRYGSPENPLNGFSDIYRDLVTPGPNGTDLWIFVLVGSQLSISGSSGCANISGNYSQYGLTVDGNSISGTLTASGNFSVALSYDGGTYRRDVNIVVLDSLYGTEDNPIDYTMNVSSVDLDSVDGLYIESGTWFEISYYEYGIASCDDGFGLSQSMGTISGTLSGSGTCNFYDSAGDVMFSINVHSDYGLLEFLSSPIDDGVVSYA